MSAVGDWLLGIEIRVRDFVSDRWYDFRELSLVVQVLLLGVPIVGGLGVAAFLVLRGPLREGKAEDLVTEARVLFEDGQITEAFQRNQQAYFLDRENLEALELMVEILRRAGHPGQVLWMERLYSLDGYDFPAFVEMIEASRQMNLRSLYRRLVLTAAELHPREPRILAESAQVLFADGEVGAAEELILEAWDTGDPGEHAIDILVAITSEAKDPEFLSRTAEVLQRVSEKEGRAACLALRGRIKLAELLGGDPARLWETLKTHPAASKNDVVQALSEEVRRGEQSVAGAWAGVAELFDLTQDDDLGVALRWLEFHQAWSLILDVVPEERVKGNGLVSWAYLVALLATDRAETARELLVDRGRLQLGLSQGQLDYLRVRAESALEGRDPVYDLQTIFDRTTPGDWPYIEGDLVRRGPRGGLRAYYEFRATGEESEEGSAWISLSKAYRAGEEGAVRDLLERHDLREFVGRTAANGWFAAYLRCLLRVRIATLPDEVGELLVNYPVHPSYGVIFAWTWLRNEDPAAAQAALVPVRAADPNLPDFIKAAALFVQMENDGAFPPAAFLRDLAGKLRLPAEQDLIQEMLATIPDGS